MTRAFAGASRHLPSVIGFRPITDDDLAFLSQLYASTRAEEVAQVADWSEEQKKQFLQMQFDAQHSYYQEQFSQAEYLLIEQSGEPIGRIYIDRRADEIRLIDIALLPAARGNRLGAALLEELLDEARGNALPVRIHVEKNNPAMRLYVRLGFVRIEDQGVYDLMEWSPGQA